MERTVVTIDAKNKREAIVCLEMALEIVREYDGYSEPVSERICVTNEGIKEEAGEIV